MNGGIRKYIECTLLIVIVFLFPDPCFAVAGQSTGRDSTEIFIEQYEENVKNLKELSYSKLRAIYFSKMDVFLYIGRPTCYYCRNFSPVIQQFNTLIGGDLYYYNLDGPDFNTEAQDFVRNILQVPGTPTTLFISEGVVVNGYVGGEIDAEALLGLLTNAPSEPSAVPNQQPPESSSDKPADESERKTLPLQPSDSTSSQQVTPLVGEREPVITEPLPSDSKDSILSEAPIKKLPATGTTKDNGYELVGIVMILYATVFLSIKERKKY